MQAVLNQNLCPDTGRVFVCGLALDFCVHDTCVNAKALGVARVSLCLDASRAAHIPGVGTWGSGFLSNPKEVLESLKSKDVGIVSYADILPADMPRPLKSVHAPTAFPASLGPLSVRPALTLNIKILASGVSGGDAAPPHAGGRYELQLQGPLKPFSLLTDFDNQGDLSPRVPLPAKWPRADTNKPATQLCWAAPMHGIRGANMQAVGHAFLAITAKPALNFAAYGGFLLLDDSGTVVEAQAVRGPSLGGLALALGQPMAWPKHVSLKPLEDQGRVQQVTIAHIRAQGATKFCWIGPEEAFISAEGDGRGSSGSNSRWVPSATGGFLYLFDNDAKEGVFFPLSSVS